MSAEFINFVIENPVLPIIFVVLLAMLLFNIFSASLRKYTDLDISATVSLINDKSPLILDVRELKERKNGCINKNKHIPVTQVKNKMNGFDKAKPILVYCSNGVRSASIAQMLGKAQFKAYNLKGGFRAWRKENMPITKQ